MVESVVTAIVLLIMLFFLGLATFLVWPHSPAVRVTALAVITLAVIIFAGASSRKRQQ